MTLTIDLTQLSAPAKKILSPGTPEKLLNLAAQGKAFGLSGGEPLAVVIVLIQHENPEIARVAQATLANPPEQMLQGALNAEMLPWAMDALAHSMLKSGREDVLEKLVAKPQIDIETLCFLASKGSERLTEIIATNEARALQEPVLIEKLYFNTNARMSTTNRLIDLAIRNNVEVKNVPLREIGEALQEELIPEDDDSLSPGDQLFQEVEQIGRSVDKALAEEGGLFEDLMVAEEGGEEIHSTIVPKIDAAKQKKHDESKPLHSRIAEMGISEKIRMATIGPAAARALFLRDTNKLVASAAIRSPMLQEQDVERISKMRTVHDEVLRFISTKGEWTENHTIKFNIVANPRTPLAQASRFVSHLREDELKRLEKSREVSAPVRALARQILQRKAKKPGA